MKFYIFDQNNSGGRFGLPAMYVFVEADSAKAANDIAREKGLYFNGVSYGRDCECCGDRWYACDESDACDDVISYLSVYSRSFYEDVPYGMVYYADGREEEIPHPEKAAS